MHPGSEVSIPETGSWSGYWEEGVPPSRGQEPGPGETQPGLTLSFQLDGQDCRHT